MMSKSNFEPQLSETLSPKEEIPLFSLVDGYSKKKKKYLIINIFLIYQQKKCRFSVLVI